MSVRQLHPNLPPLTRTLCPRSRCSLPDASSIPFRISDPLRGAALGSTRQMKLHPPQLHFRAPPTSSPIRRRPRRQTTHKAPRHPRSRFCHAVRTGPRVPWRPLTRGALSSPSWGQRDGHGAASLDAEPACPHEPHDTAAQRGARRPSCVSATGCVGAGRDPAARSTARRDASLPPPPTQSERGTPATPRRP